MVVLPSWNSIKNLPFPAGNRSYSFAYKVPQEVDTTLPYLKIAIGVILVGLAPKIYAALLTLPVTPAIVTVYAIVVIALAMITIYENRKELCRAFLKVWMARS